MLKLLPAAAAVLLMAAPSFADAASPTRNQSSFSPYYGPVPATSLRRDAPLTTTGRPVGSANQSLLAPGGVSNRCRYRATSVPYELYNPCNGGNLSIIH